MRAVFGEGEEARGMKVTLRRYLRGLKMVRVTKADSVDEDEVYTTFYRCRGCKETDIVKWHRFCPMCGKKLKWAFNRNLRRPKRG